MLLNLKTLRVGLMSSCVAEKIHLLVKIGEIWVWEFFFVLEYDFLEGFELISGIFPGFFC